MRNVARRDREDHCGAMGLVASDDNWKIPDELWSKIEPLLPPGKPHPLGCHNSRVPNRKAMNAIVFVLRTGIQWNALNGTGLCSSSSAHRRFVEWTEAGVFLEFWRRGLLAYDALKGIDWNWLSMDGAMSKAPLGGEKNRAKSHGPRQRRDEAVRTDGGGGNSNWPRRRRRQSQRLQDGA
jgi:transposase